MTIEKLFEEIVRVFINLYDVKKKYLFTESIFD